MSNHAILPSRRQALAGLLGAPAVLLGLPADHAAAQAGGTVSFIGWSAAVDQVRAQISAFERATNIRVNYENFPWAQFRTALVTRLVGNAPIDVSWVSDAWLPEFAEAGWLADINDIPQLMRYNAEAADYCTQSMTYRGRQYGLAYYGDHMSFMYNTELLQRAGIAAPPTTWEEVVQQSLRIKQQGISEYPLLLSLAADTWLIEFVSALTYAFGGRMVDDQGNAVMADANRGSVRAARFIREAIATHRIVSPGAVETPEINGLRAMGSGAHAFGIVPTYRIRALNDPSQAQAHGKIRVALMPKGGPDGTNATLGWIRFYGMTPGAKQDRARRERAVRFMEFFGGRDTAGAYSMQKLLLTDVGLPSCALPVNDDADVKTFWDRWAGGGAVIAQQATLARKKDTISPWFGEWVETSNQAWQAVCLGRAEPEAAMRTAAAKWTELRRAFR
ncbi:ABC transporter substrate-binding protein [Falsiroseomonas oryzae]|uniref:ABC transporter substrate-binding protein n=1 Tax=Falsiroseomonas oryzae TaxID=2766473 RepID=UPI0022EAB6EB|nr:extracellular solute-binding protein [Roseomonas sp. MO-31]